MNRNQGINIENQGSNQTKEANKIRVLLSTKSFDCHLFWFGFWIVCSFCLSSDYSSLSSRRASKLDKFRIGTYPSNVHSGYVLDQLWHFVDDLQDLAGQLGGTDLAISAGHHRDLLGLRQRSSHLGGHLGKLRKLRLIIDKNIWTPKYFIFNKSKVVSGLITSR